MNKTVKAALAALLAVGATQAAHAQTVASPETSTGGETVYVSGGDYGYAPQNHNGLTINGAVGLPLNPTADIPNTSGVRVQVNYFDGPRINVPGGDADSKYYGIFAAGRAGDTPLEISGGLAKFDVNSDLGFGGAVDDAIENALDKSGIVIGAKYQLRGSGEDGRGVRLAVGAGYNRALVKNIHAYLVASKAFGVGRRNINAHAGIRYDRFKYDAGFAGFDASSSKVSAFVGAEVPLDRQGRFNLVGEYGTRTSNEDDFLSSAPYSLSLRYQNGKGFAINGGIARMGLLSKSSGFIDADGSRFFVSAGQSF